MPKREEIFVRAARRSGNGHFSVIMTCGGRRTHITKDEHGNSVKIEKDARKLVRRLKNLAANGARHADLLRLLGKLRGPEVWRDPRVQEGWHEQYKERMLTGARKRARRNNIPFSIGREDLPIPQLCPVLGMRLAPSEEGAGRNDSAPSIDRIQPELGYVPGNVVVISWRANRLKWEGSATEFRKLAEWLEYVEQLPPPVEPSSESTEEE